jgi:excisionase family DNA binding protein
MTKTIEKADLTKRELAELLGVSPAAVERWVQKGIPRKRAKFGRGYLFNRVKISEWFATRKSLSKYVYGLVSKRDPAEPQENSDSPVISALDRARLAEEQAYAMLQKCGPMERMVLMELYAKMSDNRRRLEKDWSVINKSQGSAIDVAAVEINEKEAAEIIRSDLGSFPNRMSGQLSGRVFKVQEIQKILLDGIREMVKRWHESGQINKEAMP